MEEVHFVQIAPPAQSLSVSEELQPCEISDGAGWTMLAGNPLGKNQLDVTSRHRNLQLRMQDFFWRVRGVHHELDRLRRRRVCGRLRLALLRERGKRAQAQHEQGRAFAENRHSDVVLRIGRTKIKEAGDGRQEPGVSTTKDTKDHKVIAISRSRVGCAPHSNYIWLDLRAPSCPLWLFLLL